MHASDTSPDRVACFHLIRFAVQDGFSLTAQQDIPFLQRVVVDIALPTWLELHQKQDQVVRSSI
jgi:hypothetical protein